MSDAIWFLGNLMELHHGAGAAGGDALLECTEGPGAMPPLHLHRDEDEGFYVLEGTLELWAGTTHLTLGAGEAARAPRGIPHTYRTGPEGARFLVTAGPGFEAFVRAAGVPAPERRVPDPAAPDAELVGRLADEHGITLLGPPGMLPSEVPASASA
ncbi:cupin domain-containing protein [Paraconexibacter antarcticus]|uniref:Cupin domain-containing protein n=1 Tax=Paraconexibacter antarcticus TaxID=2949664 RepID=A0ABY5DWB9_9ACTN|nr:cupin domain-containing protein [Paraconexibacter antarcticus]UTI64839.1 cupin domain-containing protein [Paraconexibacter antarcticus]